MIQRVMESRPGATLGQIGQELYIEVYKLERIIRGCMPNTYTRVREFCPHCPKNALKLSKQAICAWYKVDTLKRSLQNVVKNKNID